MSPFSRISAVERYSTLGLQCSFAPAIRFSANFFLESSSPLFHMLVSVKNKTQAPPSPWLDWRRGTKTLYASVWAALVSEFDVR